MKHTYTKEILYEVVKNSQSLAGVMSKLGLIPAGGNYRTIHKWIDKESIDTSHFTGRGYLKGKTHNFNKRPIEKILVYGNFEGTTRLKLRLFQENIKYKCCEQCGLSEWGGGEIPLELHHKDGDCKNNVIENLQILCPNCHALTPNYRGKNASKEICGINRNKKRYKRKKKIYTCRCGNEMKRRSKVCKICDRQKNAESSLRPPYEILLQDRKDLKSNVKISKKYGVSDRTIANWFARYET